MFRMNVDGTANFYVDNESVVNSVTRPNSRLKKKHLSICHLMPLAIRKQWMQVRFVSAGSILIGIWLIYIYIWHAVDFCGRLNNISSRLFLCWIKNWKIGSLYSSAAHFWECFSGSPTLLSSINHTPHEDATNGGQHSPPTSHSIMGPAVIKTGRTAPSHCPSPGESNELLTISQFWSEKLEIAIIFFGSVTFSLFWPLS